MNIEREDTMNRTATVRRNSKKYTAVLTTGTRYVVHKLDNNFAGEAVDLDWARANLLDDAKRSRATMSDNQDGTFTISWHSNRWYKVTAAV